MSCCQNTPPAGDRRGFLGKVLAIVCGAFALLTPAGVGIVSFLNPLRMKGQGGASFRVATLESLPEDGSPQKAPIIADRVDAWNTIRNAQSGSVFVRRKPGTKEVEAFQAICPHAGCQINFEPGKEGGKFFCPCHSASFDLKGARTDATSSSPRDMDALAVEIRGGNEVWVRFENFKLGTSEKVVKA